MEKEVQYRWLETEELHLVDPIFEEQGWTKLNEATSRVIVAQKDGKIVGLCTLQLFPHTEPLYCSPEVRGTGVAEELADRMKAFLDEIQVRGYQAMADNEFAEKICIDRGMTKITAPVYRA